MNRYQREARARAEQFSRMKYADFDAQYFDTAFGYFAPKMLGCFGIVLVFLVVLLLLTAATFAFDLSVGWVLLSMLLMIPAGVWASTEIDAWHNRRQRKRKTGT